MRLEWSHAVAAGAVDGEEPGWEGGARGVDGWPLFSRTLGRCFLERTLDGLWADFEQASNRTDFERTLDNYNVVICFYNVQGPLVKTVLMTFRIAPESVMLIISVIISCGYCPWAGNLGKWLTAQIKLKEQLHFVPNSILIWYIFFGLVLRLNCGWHALTKTGKLFFT